MMEYFLNNIELKVMDNLLSLPIFEDAIHVIFVFLMTIAMVTGMEAFSWTVNFGTG